MANQHWLIAPLLIASICAPGSGQASQNAPAWVQKEFIITFWFSPPATDEALARVVAEGFNLTGTSEAGLDAVARHRLRAMLIDDLIKPEVLDDPAKRQQLDALIARVKNHPALEACFLDDEPGAKAFRGLGRLVAYLKERDPAHLAYINLFPTYANEQQLGVSADAAERARVGYPLNFAGVGTDDKTGLAYRQAAAAPESSEASMMLGSGCTGRVRELRDTCVALKARYVELWNRENRPFALDVVTRRFDAVIAYYDDGLKRLSSAEEDLKNRRPLPPIEQIGFPAKYTGS